MDAQEHSHLAAHGLVLQITPFKLLLFPPPVSAVPAPNSGPDNSAACCTAEIGGGYSLPCSSVNSVCKAMPAADVASINCTTPK